MSELLASNWSLASMASDEPAHSTTNEYIVSSSNSQQRNDLETHHFTTNALGASVSLAIVHTDIVAARQIATKAFEEIKRLERIFSLYILNSALVDLNTNKELAYPSAELLSIFSQVTGVWQATEGAFDPTVQPHWNQRNTDFGKQPTFSWNNISYSSASIEFDNPDMAITLNGIAQGYISEKIAELLRSQGLENVLVNVGEIVAVGNRSDGRPWQIGLAERQTDWSTDTLELANMAIATSAPLSRMSDSSVAAGHIIDPATGRSCESIWQHLSVVHPSAAIADGLSTGLVMKSEEGIRKAISHYPQAEVFTQNINGDQQKFTHRS